MHWHIAWHELLDEDREDRASISCIPRSVCSESALGLFSVRDREAIFRELISATFGALFRDSYVARQTNPPVGWSGAGVSIGSDTWRHRMAERWGRSILFSVDSQETASPWRLALCHCGCTSVLSGDSPFSLAKECARQIVREPACASLVFVLFLVLCFLLFFFCLLFC